MSKERHSSHTDPSGNSKDFRSSVPRTRDEDQVHVSYYTIVSQWQTEVWPITVQFTCYLGRFLGGFSVIGHHGTRAEPIRILPRTLLLKIPRKAIPFHWGYNIGRWWVWVCRNLSFLPQKESLPEVEEKQNKTRVLMMVSGPSIQLDTNSAPQTS